MQDQYHPFDPNLQHDVISRDLLGLLFGAIDLIQQVEPPVLVRLAETLRPVFIYVYAAANDTTMPSIARFMSAFIPTTVRLTDINIVPDNGPPFSAITNQVSPFAPR